VSAAVGVGATVAVAGEVTGVGDKGTARAAGEDVSGEGVDEGLRVSGASAVGPTGLQAADTTSAAARRANRFIATLFTPSRSA
jgi:hypothetical protein